MKTPGLDLFLWMAGLLCLSVCVVRSVGYILTLLNVIQAPTLSTADTLVLTVVGALAMKASFQ